MSQNSDNKMFRLGVILSQEGVTIIPQGKMTISYAKLIAGVVSVTLFICATMPIVSQFISSDLLLNLLTSVTDYSENINNN